MDRNVSILPTGRRGGALKATRPAQALTLRGTTDTMVPALPEPPAAVMRAIGGSMVAVFDGNGDYAGARLKLGEEAVDLRPEDVPMLRQQLDEVSADLAPADSEWLLGRVFTLLQHYRSARDPLPPVVEQAIAQDWVEDLAEFPAWAIAEAVREWRQTQKFAPKICEIRERCHRAIADHARLHGALTAALHKLERRPDARPTANAIVAQTARALRRV